MSLNGPTLFLPSPSGEDMDQYSRGIKHWRLPSSYGPDYVFEGTLLVVGWSEEGNRACIVGIFRTDEKKYLTNTTFYLNINPPSRLSNNEAVKSIRELITMMYDKTRDPLFIKTLKHAMMRAGVDVARRL